MSFVKKESFKHEYAKKLLCEWLNENCGGKWHGDGAHMEYPLIPAMKQENFGNVIGYGYSTGDDRYNYYESITTNFNPTYQQCVANNDIPVAVLDIAVVYKGCLFEGFEVYHTHKVDDEKKEKIKKLTEHRGFELYEISAETILRHTEKPKNILELCNKLL
jgi:hypothetical protein